MKIGFIDYFISEWHANNYPNWIKECSDKLNIDASVAYVYAELEVSPYDNVTTDDWCQKFAVKKCSSIEEVCEKSDAIIILSPDNPEKHLEYAKIAFKYAKPVYVDKTFAPNLADAKEMFTIAENYNTPFFTSSALGFADEVLNIKENVHSVITTGGGSKLDIYIIHQLEMVVKLMGTGSKQVISSSNGLNASIAIKYENGRNAQINFNNGYGFSVAIEKKANSAEQSFYFPIESGFFINLISAILEFFTTKNLPVSKEHTLEVIALRDAVLASQNQTYVLKDVIK